MSKKRGLLLESAVKAPEAVPAPVHEATMTTEREVARAGALDQALAPYESDTDRRTFVVEQLLAAEYWDSEGLTVKVPVGMLTSMLRALSGYAAEKAAQKMPGESG